MIPDHLKDKILAYGGENIVSIIGSYVTLHKEGHAYKACCPFHGEKTPSFTVDPARQSWRCFGSCSDGGNVAKFVMLAEGIKFPAAMQKIADMAGIPMGDDDSKEVKERKAMLLVLAKANSFFQTELCRHPDARAYVASRLSPEMVSQHGIGFAPANGGKALVSYLTKEKLPLWAAEKAGLIRKVEEKDGEYMDRYWGRMIFPIKNAAGYVIGFGGRAITAQAKVKYINSPETPLYKKYEVLYGLDQAKEEIKASGEALIVEGYLDWLQAWAAGVRYVVATCGTAFTESHAAILSRYTRKVTFMFDGDAPGQKALQKAVPIATDAGLSVSAFILADGVDPDDYFKAGGELENLKPQSGLAYLVAAGIDLSVTYKKLLRLERLEAGMLWFAENNHEVAAVLAKRGNLQELFGAVTAARLSTLFGEKALRKPAEAAAV